MTGAVAAAGFFAASLAWGQDEGPGESTAHGEISIELLGESATEEDERRELMEELRTLRSEVEAQRVELDKLNDQKNAPPDRDTEFKQRESVGYDVVVVSGEETDKALAVGGDVIVAGTVFGDATSIGGDVLVSDGGRVEGKAISVGGEIIVAEGGFVARDRVAIAPQEHVASMTGGSDRHSLLTMLYHRLLFMLSFGGVGVLVVGLFPNRVGRVADTLWKRPLVSTVVGILTTSLLACVGGSFFLTFLGIPVTLLAGAVFGMALILGFVGLCQAVGDRLPLRQKHHGRWLAFLIGTVLLCCVSALPAVGWLVLIGACTSGLGAAVMTRFGTR